MRHLIALLFTLLVALPAAAEDGHAAAQQQMLREVVEMTHDTSFETGRERLDARVLQALKRVPRHRFVPPGEQGAAYENRPLPIGHGQTISQPYIVALMTDLLHPRPGDKVLEIGTGSGYQAAVLAAVGARTWSIEIIEPLAERARQNLDETGYRQVRTRAGDGYYGWQEAAPFDAILVTAAASHVPPPLVKQLKPGGRMVIPVGGPFLTQHLMLVEKLPEGGVRTRQILPVCFVPLVGGH